MKARTIVRIGLFAACLPLAGFTLAEQERNVYGWELMSPQEREAHREKMRSFQTEQEREQSRMEHHQRMQERAEEQGVTLPDMPHARGSGQGGAGQGR